MKKQTRKKSILSLLLILAVGFLFLTGLNWPEKNKVSLNTEEYRVYEHRKVFTVMNAVKHGSKEDWKDYDGAYVALFGYAQDVKFRSKSFDLAISELEDSTSIRCKANDATVANEIATLTAGKPVIAYGKLSVGLNKSVSMSLDSFEIVDSDSFDENAVTTGKGKYTYALSELLERSLNEGEVKYYIPQRWEQVEHDIVAEGLGVMEGYQYRLNEIQKGAEYAQSLFVCYFDIEDYVAMNDRKDKELIEEAILRDILGKDAQDDMGKLLVRKEDATYYGTKYNYYQDGYEKPLAESYRTEFVFQEINDKGLLVYLYVYNNKKEDQGRIKEEALMVMRLLEAQ